MSVFSLVNPDLILKALNLAGEELRDRRMLGEIMVCSGHVFLLRYGTMTATPSNRSTSASTARTAPYDRPANGQDRSYGFRMAGSSASYPDCAGMAPRSLGTSPPGCIPHGKGPGFGYWRLRPIS
jgi:hypothetical protein